MDQNSTEPTPAATPAPAAPDGRPDVLVTGASGFVGGHLTRRLAERGHRVRVLVRSGSDRTGCAEAAADVVVGALDDVGSLRRATAGVTHVYNCAGMSADWGPWEDFRQANVDGAKNVVEAAHAAGTVRRVLHVSTTDVYGYPRRPCDESTEPTDIGLPYNRSKLLGERAVRLAADRTGVPVTVVRPVSVYGPGSKDFVIEIGNLLRQGQMVYIRKGEVPAGLIYVDNLIEAMINAATSDQTAGKVYNLRDPELTTWREYIGALAEGMGLKPPRMSLPTPVATTVATVSEGLYRTLGIKARPVLTRHAVHLFDRDQSYAIDRAQGDFGFKSEIDFPEGLRRTLAWLDSAEGRAHVAR